ncbi:MAG: ABC transporter permease [Melioribacteraceae bacterium]|nr:ABC transporter permease [Melioribacteraceae bacterium]
MYSRTKAIAKKEFKHLLRDKRFLFVIIFLPIFLLVIFGYAVNFDVQNIKLSVLDKDKSKNSREFINSISSSSYFSVTSYLKSDKEVKDVLDRKKAQAVLVIPKDFSEKIEKNKETADVQFLIDGVDGNAATIIKSYIEIGSLKFNRSLQERLITKLGQNINQPLNLEAIFWFNPDLQTTKFLIPGLIAMILIITAVISVSLSLVREKEFGTIEQINVSSVHSIELLVGKSLPYILLSLIDAVLILLVGYLVFGVIVKGSYSLLFITSLIYIVASTALGIFISVIANSQQVAFLLATFSTLLPSIILSGFIFPIESMPYLIQILTNISPAKFYIVILRSIIIKGVGLSSFWDQLVYLLIFAFLFLTIAVNIYRKKTDTIN